MKAALILTAAATALTIALPAMAAPYDHGGGRCFWTRDLRNHTVADSHTLYFDVGGRDVYRVETSDNCLSAATSSDPIVMNNTASGGQICNKLDLNISIHGARCIVSSLTRLTPREAAALPPRLRP
jgi:hypothetical protein